MTQRVKVLLFSLVVLVTTQVAFAQQGWQRTKQGDALVYTPTDIATDKTFKVIIPEPEALNGKELKQWFLAKAKEMQTSLGKALKPWKVKPDGIAKWSLSNSFINSTGKQLSVGYQGEQLANGDALIMQVIMEKDFSIMMKYGVQLNALKNEAEKLFADKPALAKVMPEKEQNNKQSGHPGIQSYKSIGDSIKAADNTDTAIEKNYREYWIKTNVGNNIVYTPKTIEPGKLFRIKFFQILKNIKIINLKQYALQKAESLQPKNIGRALHPWKIQSDKANSNSVVNLFNHFKDNKGTKYYIKFTFIYANNVLVSYQILSQAEPALIKKHMKHFKSVSQDAKDELFKYAKTLKYRNIAGFKAGGKIRAGVYKGKQFKNGKIYSKDLELILFEDASYKWRGKSQDKPYDYSEETGELGLWLRKSFFAGADYTLYGIETKTHKPTVYAYKKDNWGVKTLKLQWTAPIDKSEKSPIEVAKEKEKQKAIEKQKEIAKEKALRTEPGKGVQMNEIEVLLYETKADYSSVLIQINEYVHLLLKDGSYYQDLSIAPSIFNVTGSRKHEPDKWGKWRKKNGKYEVKMSDGNKWRRISGVNVLGNTRLKRYGYYGRLKAYGNPIMGNVSTSRQGFTLKKNGRFESSSFSLFTGGSWTPDINVSAATIDDKKGKRTTVGATGGDYLAVDINKQNKKTGSDKTGRYEINNHTITFYHDSGRTTRELFFVNGSEIFIGHQYYGKE